MKSFALSSLLFISTVSAAALTPLVRREDPPVCRDLSVKSNDGNRKVAIVIDSSGSMYLSDPTDLRLVAGRSLVDWLISDAEAAGKSTPDQVTVIDFDDAPNMDFPLGDPGRANSSFDGIGAGGGTYIAGGVELAIAELTSNGTATNTASRSSIVVFTDGEDSDTESLVNQINAATAAGIRVSFGFLDSYSTTQDKDVLFAIGKSGGVYATITTEASSNNFINYVILNGLTTNDNPQGNNKTLLAGLSTTHFITGSQTQDVVYYSQANERVAFTIQSIDAGPLTAEAKVGSKTLNGTKTGYLSSGIFYVTTGNPETISIKVTATNAPRDSMFLVGATSNMPSQNCTVGIGPSKSTKSGMSLGGKVGVGITIPVIAGLLGIGGYFLLKHLGYGLPKVLGSLGGAGAGGAAGAGGGGAAAPPYYPTGAEKGVGVAVADLGALGAGLGAAAPALVPPTNPTNAQDHHRRPPKPRTNKEEPHHHHLFPGHPCAAQTTTCALAAPGHICKDPNAEPIGPCTCTDRNCALNNTGTVGFGGHDCSDGENMCWCEEPECPETKRTEQRKAMQTGVWAGKQGISEAVRAFT